MVGTSAGKELVELRSRRQWEEEFVRNVLEMKKDKMMCLKLQSEVMISCFCPVGRMSPRQRKHRKPQMPHNPAVKS